MAFDVEGKDRVQLVQRLSGVKGFFSTAVVAMVIAALAGCAAEPAPEVTIEDGVAILDPTNATITLPLASYAVSSEELRLSNRAQDLVLQDCYSREAGYLVPPIVDRLKFRGSEGRFHYYGVWVAEEAAKYGYEKPPSVGLAEFLAWETSFPEGVREAAGECARSSPEWEKFGSILDSLTGGLAARGEGQSYRWAEQHELWHELVESCQQCMAASGYTFDGVHGPFGPAEITLVLTEGDGGPSEAQILMALNDVECKDNLRLVQRLSDLVAAYEKIFIEQNEAALVEEQKVKNEKLAEIQEFIDSHRKP